MRVAYIADDGAEFATEGEALRYEGALANTQHMDDFLVSIDAKGKKIAEYKRVVLSWELFRTKAAGE